MRTLPSLHCIRAARVQVSQAIQIVSLRNPVDASRLFGLVNPAIFHTEEWVRDGQARTVHFYDYGAYRIWGVTARMLNSLLETINRHE